MSFHFCRSHSIAIAVAITLSIAAPTYAGQTSVASKHRGTAKSLKVYEDSEIKVTIPTGWSILLSPKDKAHEGTLVLEKPEYQLSLAYHADHASGIDGGRLVEILEIPWEQDDAGVNCSGYLRREPWPASRNLIFINLVVDSGDPRVQENCDIKGGLGSWTEKAGQKEYDGDARWLGGYFAAEYGGYFFGGNDGGCGLKAYTLTSKARMPDQLPIADIPNQNNNPALEKIIQEAIDIVNSIQYRRCSPF